MAGLNVRYWAGMIWSVSTLSPRTYAFPAIDFCMVNCPSSVVRGPLSFVLSQRTKENGPRTPSNEIPRIGDGPGQGAGGDGQGAGEENTGLLVAHAAGKVAVGGADAAQGLVEPAESVARA